MKLYNEQLKINPTCKKLGVVLLAVPANPGPPGKWPLKRTERELQINLSSYMSYE